jgi:hypothetical protein
MGVINWRILARLKIFISASVVGRKARTSYSTPW